MSNSQEGPSRSPIFFGIPRSRLGWWSISLAIAFVVLFVLWGLYVMRWRPIARPTFYSDPLSACLSLGGAAAGISGAIVGVLALAAKRERSYMILLSVLLGAFVVYLAIAKLINPHP
jgi:hypothetical protein